MRKIATLILGLCLLSTVTACKGETSYGECVGLDDQEDMDPNLKYDLSARNFIWSLVGIETIVAPVLWVTDYAYCPESRKRDANKALTPSD